MQEIEIFKHKQFGEIRTMTDEQGEPWFVGKDVAEALGYSNTRDALRKHVDEEDKTTVAICDTGSNYKSSAVVINESGLYSLILSSKLESAKQFKRWVTSEVLPQIRKTGGYSLEVKTEVQPMTDVEIMARAVLISAKQIEELTNTVALLAPKAEYCDEVLDSVSCMTTTQIAKELEMSAIELNRWLCEQGIQYWQSDQYMLYADYARRGFAKNRSHSYRGSDGEMHTKTYLVWTERGREFIHKKLSV